MSTQLEQQQPPLGWLDWHERTDDQNETHENIVAAMPSFDLPASAQELPPKGTKILLTDCWKHARVKSSLNLPKGFPGWHQDSGCCVGVGFGDGAQTTNILDVLQRGDSEEIGLIFWPFNYGRSRQLAGMRGQGQGSMGSTIARSASEDGVLIWKPGLSLPDYSVNGMLGIGKSEEMIWSDGQHASAEVREEGKPHRIISAPVSSGLGVVGAIMNGYACLRAFAKYVQVGSAQVKDGALIGHYDGRGGHQESWQAFWHHPTQGPLIGEMNQWGQNVYGIDPGGLPPGACWVPLDEVDRECQRGEIYALNNYDGYPSKPEFYDWINRSFYS